MQGDYKKKIHLMINISLSLVALFLVIKVLTSLGSVSKDVLDEPGAEKVEEVAPVEPAIEEPLPQEEVVQEPEEPQPEPTDPSQLWVKAGEPCDIELGLVGFDSNTGIGRILISNIGDIDIYNITAQFDNETLQQYSGWNLTAADSIMTEPRQISKGMHTFRVFSNQCDFEGTLQIADA